MEAGLRPCSILLWELEMEGLGQRSQDFRFGAVALETALSGPRRCMERQDQIPGKGQPSCQCQRMVTMAWRRCSKREWCQYSGLCHVHGSEKRKARRHGCHMMPGWWGGNMGGLRHGTNDCIPWLGAEEKEEDRSKPSERTGNGPVPLGTDRATVQE